MTNLDLLIIGARVLDPHSGTDAFLNVGVKAGRIDYLGTEQPAATKIIDATGRILAPGFIDLHSHAQNVTGHRLQALDGVTTTLELEAGAAPLSETYAWAETEGRPVNFGYSAGWLYTRMHVMDGRELVDPAGDYRFRVPLDTFSNYQGGERWNRPASTQELDTLIGLLRGQLEAGAIGVGMLLGYAPEVEHSEVVAVAKLCAELNQPLIVHGRFNSTLPGRTSTDAVIELIDISRQTGCHIHLCHFASTAHSSVAESAAVIVAAAKEGVRFSTESYPFGTASTVIGAEFLAPEALESQGITSTSITYLKSGERVSSPERLAELRSLDPGGLSLIDYYDEQDPADLATLIEALTLPNAAFASDAMPVRHRGDDAGREQAELEMSKNPWPVPDDFIAHPRGTSCFARSIAWVHRDLGQLTLMEAIARSTSIPADILSPFVPAMRTKGRIEVGADADLVIFDLDRLEPSTNYFQIETNKGFDYVLVAGTPVVADGELITEAMPGTAIKTKRI